LFIFGFSQLAKQFLIFTLLYRYFSAVNSRCNAAIKRCKTEHLVIYQLFTTNHLEYSFVQTIVELHYFFLFNCLYFIFI